ncbi:Na+/H+ antiporter subunit E [Cytophagaceae bacterium ABcell3]|nr:Na+/H+ antiporter subunit E [Cytophagaceae bacterium ABcell3]
MQLLLANVLLTIVWLILTGRFDPTNFMFGFVLSYLILWLVLRTQTQSRYFDKLPKLLLFVGYFLVELVKANIRVAYDILTLRHHMHPGILAVPLEAKSDIEITLLANFITLTPGTLSMDVSTDRKVIYIHFMYIDDEDLARKSVKDFEKRILDIVR